MLFHIRFILIISTFHLNIFRNTYLHFSKSDKGTLRDVLPAKEEHFHFNINTLAIY